MAIQILIPRDVFRFMVINGLAPGSSPGMRFHEYITGKPGSCAKYLIGEGRFMVSYEDEQEAMILKLKFGDMTDEEIVLEMQADIKSNGPVHIDSFLRLTFGSSISD